MPKLVDHDERRGYIVDAAWGLIMKGGIEAATMREIATEAGFANGALKYYFPGKDEIIDAAYQRALGAMTDQVAAAIEGKTGLAALRTFVETTLPIDEDAQSAARVLLSFWAHGVANERLRLAYQEHLATWRTALIRLTADARRRDEVRSPLADEVIVDEIVLMNVGATVLAVAGPQFVTPATLRALVDAFFARLQAA